MLSKSQLSYVKSLHHKKFRTKHRLFIVEGHKSIEEFINSKYNLTQLFYTSDLSSKVAIFPHNMKFIEISSSDLKKISALKNPNGILALFEIPDQNPANNLSLKDKYTLVLDGIQDPGNLGTIIRTADWFGIENIICSLDSVDCFNPKVVQASMGSLARVRINYVNLSEWLPSVNIKLYGALLKGTSISHCNFSEIDDKGKERKEGLILLGNEGQGISADLISLIDEPITINRLGAAESLNVAIAASLICYEIRRN